MFNKEYGKNVEIIGRWFIKNYGPNGVLKDELSGKNIITENGLSFLASFLNDAAAGATVWDMDQIAIGTDATAEAASNTALGIESARTTGTAAYTSSAVYSVSATFAAGVGTGAIVEYGLFSSSTGGTMFSRDTEAVINKAAGDTLVVTTEVTFN